MNKIRLGVFDVFSYIIPGIFYSFVFLSSLNIFPTNEIIRYISSASVNLFFTYLLVAYIIGFVFDWFASKYFKIIYEKSEKRKVIEHFKNENPDSNISNYYFGFIYAFAEVNCPNNRNKADHFSSLRNMSRNLSFCFQK